jgi:hypothetical protein
MKLDFCVSHNYTQRDLLHHHDSIEIPPKTRYKQKQNETLENITHFIHLSLKNTILGVLHNISENNKFICNYENKRGQ